MDTHGFVVIPNFLGDDVCKDLAQRILADASKGIFTKGDEQTYYSLCCYNYEPTLTLLNDLRERLSCICNKDIAPTYAYSRIYVNNEELQVHVDREACEYSVSINIFQDQEWALHIRDKSRQQFVPVSLNVGDAVIYKGRELLHYRDRYKGDQYIQVFLHYVDVNGPYSDWINDKKPNII